MFRLALTVTSIIALLCFGGLGYCVDYMRLRRINLSIGRFLAFAVFSAILYAVSVTFLFKDSIPVKPFLFEVFAMALVFSSPMLSVMIGMKIGEMKLHKRGGDIRVRGGHGKRA